MRRALVAAALALACGEPGAATVQEPTAAVQWITLDCDPIAPAYCGHPFPSNVFTIDDDAAPTGRRVALSAAMMPTTRAGVQALPDTWSSLSGCTPDNQTDPCVGL